MGITTYYRNKLKVGFSLVELMVVIAALAVLALIVYSTYSTSEETAIENAETSNLENIANAMKLYLYKNNAYPPDGNGGIPTELKPYLNTSWPPKPAWNLPGVYYDYDSWSVDPASGGAIDTRQVGVRFCSGSGGVPVTCAANYLPSNASWTSGFTSSSAYYWCITGYCRPNGYLTPTTYPGYCVNCANHTGVKYPGES